MTKIELESKILNKRRQIEKLERRQAKNLANPNADPYDIRRDRYELEQANATLVKYLEQLRKAELDAALPEIPLIRSFLEQWEQRCIEWHNKEVEEYVNAYHLMEQEKFIESLDPNQVKYLAYRIYGRHSEYKFFRAWADAHISQFAQEHTSYKNRCLNEDGIKLIRKERDSKYVKFLRQILAITGDVTDVRGLRIGAEGDINGVVIGTKGKASVNTFGAGGYNIQCFHFRTTIKEVK